MRYIRRRSTYLPEESGERGAVLVLTALSLILLLVIAAFSTDLGAWYQQGQEQQRSADVAALSGVKSYNAHVRDELLAFGVDRMAELSEERQLEIETIAFPAAVADVIAGLRADGREITASPTISVAVPPAWSVAEVTSVDGSLIRITRKDGGAVTVNISNVGDQFFSSFVRNEPTISREAVAALSMCGAVCNDTITVLPPVSGFSARGFGDGFIPLVDWPDQRVYAVNHHAGPNSGGVVCKHADTGEDCAGFPLQIPSYRTTNRSEDAIDIDRNRVYFAVKHTETFQFGVACVDSNGTFCPFTPLMQGPVGSAFNQVESGMLGGVGTWFIDDRIFAASQDGFIHCIEPDQIGSASPFCAGYPRPSGMRGHPNQPAASFNIRGGVGTADHENGRIWIHQGMTNGQAVVHCWDVVLDAVCPTFSGATTVGGGSQPTLWFMRYDTRGDVVGWCKGDTGLNHVCVDEFGVRSNNAIPQLAASALGPEAPYGNGRTYDGKRMYYSQGITTGGLLRCYDWETRSSCTAAGDEVPPIYGTAQLNRNCMVGIGHTSMFYAWDGLTLEPCGESGAQTQLWPCVCADGSERYGELSVPENMDQFLNSIEATITGGGMTVGPTDLLLGPLDLSSFNGTSGPLTLTLDVNFKQDANGVPLWNAPIDIDLQIETAPTLLR